jgi:caffeoyl-CoA O-methyltransferase
MGEQQDELQRLSDAENTRKFIDAELNRRFAPEDEALRGAVAAAASAAMPAIQISPLQGKLLQVLAAACGARKILEIGALAGYSTIWLARALPPGGKLISLEISEQHAQVARASVERAGLSDRVEVRVGPGAQLLPALQSEGPFDLIFIDADKESYPIYLDWALNLSRPGTVVVADNCIRGGRPFRSGEHDEVVQGVATYDERVAQDSRLCSVVLPLDDDGTDGFAISVVTSA